MLSFQNYELNPQFDIRIVLIEDIPIRIKYIKIKQFLFEFEV